MPEYVIAAKRAKRVEAPANWLDRVRRMPGVTLHGTVAGRAQVEVPDQTLPDLQRELGDYLHIEPVIVHQRR